MFQIAEALWYLPCISDNGPKVTPKCHFTCQILDILAGIALLSVGGCALSGRISLPPWGAYTMIGIGSFQFLPLCWGLVKLIIKTCRYHCTSNVMTMVPGMKELPPITPNQPQWAAPPDA